MTHTSGNQDWQLQCYGCTEADLERGISESITVQVSGHRMLALSILSDAQELLAMERNEEARQYINRAKYVMTTHLGERTEGNA